MNKAMKMISALGLATALSLGMAATAVAFSGGHGGKHQQLERMADKLGLSDEQQQQFKQIHRQARPQMLTLKDAMQDNREALHKLNPESPQFDKQVAEIARQRGELITQEVIQHSQMRASFFAILTPEQREMSKNMKRDHSGKRGKHCGQHGRMSR